MMIHVFGWILVALSMAGVILNIKKKRACFYIWICTNASWCIVDAMHGLYHQAVLFFVYFLLAVWGVIEWKKEDRVKGSREQE